MLFQSVRTKSPITAARRQTSLPGRHGGLNLEIGARAYSDSILIGNVSTPDPTPAGFSYLSAETMMAAEKYELCMRRRWGGGLLSDHRAAFVLVGVVAIQGSDGEMMRDQCSESL